MINESEFTDEYVLKLQEEINKLTAESTEWEERTYCWQDRAENLQIVLDKIKEYAGELRLFDNESVEFEISSKILELLEEIE